MMNSKSSCARAYAWGRFVAGSLILLCSFAASASDRHRPIVTMGRDFWHGFVAGEMVDALRKDNPELAAHPAFSDAVLCYSANALPPPAETGLAVWPRIEDCFRPNDASRWILATCPDPTRPFFLSHGASERPRTTWGSPVRLDLAAYRAWCAARPNMMYDGRISEWCNDLNGAWESLAGRRGTYVGNLPDSTNRFEALKRFMGARPTTRYEQLDLLRRYYAMRRERNFGGRMFVMDAHLNTLHIAADFGASYICMETTASGQYRYQPSAMFTRGASRQFGVPWEWYVAGYMNGPSKRYPGERLGDAMCRFPQSARASGEPRYGKKTANGRMRVGNGGADFGISRSVFRRTHYLAYLSGANFVMLEDWYTFIAQWDKSLGRKVLSPRGRIYADFIDFTRAHPNRGTHYSPVAVCVPLAQAYPTWGGSPFSEPRFGYTEGDKAVDAVFFTLVPGCDHGACLARGDEKLIRNSPYANMYDVIVPDAESQTPDQILAVMKSYKALVVAGDYRDRSWEKSLAKYEAAGGKVVRVDKALLGDAVTSGRKRGIALGETRYPKLEAALRQLQKDYFPFEVTGSCAYGMSVAKDHVWLYVFNNDGVIKFADAPQEFDQTKASDIRVKLGSGSCEFGMKDVTELLSGKAVSIQDGAFRWHLGPGEFAIFEMKQPTNGGSYCEKGHVCDNLRVLRVCDGGGATGAQVGCHGFRDGEGRRQL